jgi:hypothetical protein
MRYPFAANCRLQSLSWGCLCVLDPAKNKSKLRLGIKKDRDNYGPIPGFSFSTTFSKERWTSMLPL